ncbi:MAG TPA: carbohydrate ABC transporter permease [Solirubrobacteraceae bacterium]|nr:carbohydrate ABC transporter permease [Solirubrobacteraceae bacterium]
MTTTTAPTLRTPRRRRRSLLRQAMPDVAWWAICGLVALMFLFPLAMVVFTVLKTPSEAAATPPHYLPHHISGQNFRALSDADIWRYVLNSAVVSLGTVLGTVILATLAGYGFARYRFPGRSLLFLGTLMTLMVPFQALLTPLYSVLLFLHMANSLVGLTLVYITFQLPFSLFVMRNAFAEIPQDIEDAAAMDGATTLATLRRVMVTVAKPAVVTVALFAFFSAWNEFLAALIFLSDQARYTLPVFLTTLVVGKLGAINWGLLEAGVVVTIAPCLVIFLLLQRYYVRGLMSGAVR